jgi:Peptidase family M28
MSRLSAAIVSLGLVCGAGFLAAQAVDFKATGAPIAPAPVDKEIAAAIAAASSEKIHQNIETLVNFKTRMTTNSVETDLAPGTGVLAAAAWIKEQFEAISKDCGGCLEVKEDSFIEPGGRPGLNGAPSRIAKDTKLVNIYAILKGTDPAQSKRMYLVTGHYDTRITDTNDDHSFAPGANDDTSGTAVSLECARILSKHKFPATLVFVTVPGEEQGLNGSHHLAVLAKQEGWDLEGVLNNDIVGGDTTPGDTLQSKSLVRVFSEGVPASATEAEMRRIVSMGAEGDSPSRELAREILDTARTYFPAPTGSAKPAPTFLHPVMEMRLDRYGRGGDHRSFNEQGFAAVRFTEWRENYNHQHQNVRTENGIEYGDLLKFDDFDYIAKVARLNAATLATMASAPGAPKQAHMSARSQNNDSTFTFQAPDGAPADTWYEIVWRETGASDWQYSGKAADYKESVQGDNHTVTVPVSKDNVFFGVRSCDSKGHCSAAIAPVPEVATRTRPAAAQ